MNRAEYAVELKHKKHNCAQAVLCAYEEELGIPAYTLRALGAAFGAGMGCMEATCGALCGAQMVLGLKKYEGKPIGGDAVDVLMQFERRCGAILCKDLKGRDTGKMLCSCDDCVRNAVTILEEKFGNA